MPQLGELISEWVPPHSWLLYHLQLCEEVELVELTARSRTEEQPKHSVRRPQGAGEPKECCAAATRAMQATWRYT